MALYFRYTYHMPCFKIYIYQLRVYVLYLCALCLLICVIPFKL